MRLFNTKEVAKIVGVHEETVRRWIRGGRIEAQQDSKKDGNFISENSLANFLKECPKYWWIALTHNVDLIEGESIENNAALLRESIYKKREDIEKLEQEISEEMTNLELLNSILIFKQMEKQNL